MYRILKIGSDFTEAWETANYVMTDEAIFDWLTRPFDQDGFSLSDDDARRIIAGDLDYPDHCCATFVII